MFIKRWNRVKVASKSGDRHRSGGVKCSRGVLKYNSSSQEISGQSCQQEREGEDEEGLPEYLGEDLKAYRISVDPHGRYLAIYSDHSNSVYLLTIFEILDKFKHFRCSCPESTYSMGEQDLPRAEHVIKSATYTPNEHSLRADLNVLDLKFTHCVQSTQILIIAYFPNVVHLFSVATAKKLDCISLQEGATIMEVTAIGLSVFISTYDGQLYVYEGKELTKCQRYSGEWVRFRYDCLHQDNRSHWVPLFSDRFDRLFLGSLEITSSHSKSQHPRVVRCDKEEHSRCDKEEHSRCDKEEHSRCDKEEHSRFESSAIGQKCNGTSFEEFIKLEKQRYCQTRSKSKLSSCEKFLVTDVGGEGSRFRLRFRHFQWDYFCKQTFFFEPVVNQYIGQTQPQSKNYCIFAAIRGSIPSQASTTKNQPSQLERTSQGNENLGKIGISSLQQKMITIFKIERRGKEESREKGNEDSKRRESEDEKIIKICEVRDLKAAVDSIYWIGPNTILFLDSNYNIYYLDFDASLFFHPDPSHL